jgi:hypothetical protein
MNQQSIYYYFSNTLRYQSPQNLQETDITHLSLNFRPVQNYDQNQIMNIENTVIKKLNKTLNKCDNKDSY